MSEVRTTRLYQGYLWKQGRTGVWVKRYYVLVRREQIDPMVTESTDVMHELCTFDSHSEHAECLSSFEIESVLTFESGPDCGLTGQERARAVEAREQAQMQGIKSLGSIGFGEQRRSLFTGLLNYFALKLTTDAIADFTLQLNFENRTLRLRAESKTAFAAWNALFAKIVVPTKAPVAHQGWVWRKSDSNWVQHYAAIYNGVMFLFRNAEACDTFRTIAARGNDELFIAATHSQAAISLEHCESEVHDVMGDRHFVVSLTVEDPPLSECISPVDEVQANAWVLAIRTARQSWSTFADDHVSRKLFGRVGDEEDGPMLAQNDNPMADLYGDDAAAREKAEAAARAAAERKAKREAARIQRREEKQAMKEAAVMLAKLPEMKDLGSRKRFRIAKQLEREAFGPQQVIFRQGDEGHKFYLIKLGSVVVTRRMNPTDTEDKVLVTLKPGDFFGEVALRNNAPRAATITTLTNVVLFSMERLAFEKLNRYLDEIMEAKENAYRQQVPGLDSPQRSNSNGSASGSSEKSGRSGKSGHSGKSGKSTKSSKSNASGASGKMSVGGQSLLRRALSSPLNAAAHNSAGAAAVASFNATATQNPLFVG